MPDLVLFVVRLVVTRLAVTVVHGYGYALRLRLLYTLFPIPHFAVGWTLVDYVVLARCYIAPPLLILHLPTPTRGCVVHLRSDLIALTRGCCRYR